MWHTLYRNSVILLFSASSFLFAGAAIAQLTTSDAPEWIGSLVAGNTDLTSHGDPEYAAEELPGLGRKFQLLFAMVNSDDPQNLTNDTIKVFTTQAFPAGIGVALRQLTPGIKITALDHQINLKYFFPTAPRTCAGGSPRIQLAIDGDGDGSFNQVPGGPDQNAFGYVGHAPFGTGCVTGEWDIIDMTDNIGRWDLSQFGGSMTMTWDQAELFITTAFPNHRVLSGSLVDDSCSFAATACGEAHYDLLTIENRTLENDQDTVKRN